MLTEEEKERYDRQIRIQGFGVEGQKKLKQAKILVAGVRWARNSHIYPFRGGWGQEASELWIKM